jgi:hypothetical protein
MKKLILASVLGTALISGGIVLAKPVVNVSPKKHPHINAAQTALVTASKQITEAQVANEWDLGGHAKKAKELIDQADGELKLAAEVSNENHEK